MQGGGVLNAFATRFIGSDIVVLYTDLIEACGDDEAARDMIIAHELGHLHCGHVRWNFLIAPAMIVPFLSGALSRAREYTCDRYGRAGAGSAEGAALGLTILAAGGRLARRVDRRVLMSQHSALNTGWMTLGQWLSTHPPLVKRIAQVDPSLRRSVFRQHSRRGTRARHCRRGARAFRCRRRRGGGALSRLAGAKRPLSPQGEPDGSGFSTAVGGGRDSARAEGFHGTGVLHPGGGACGPRHAVGRT